MKTRRRFSAEFKAKVALEAIKGHETTPRGWWTPAAVAGQPGPGGPAN